MSTSIASHPIRRNKSGERLLRFLSGSGLVLALVVLSIIVIGAIEPRFLSRLNLLNVGRNASYLAIVAIGQMFVMKTGGFDLAIGSMIAASSVVTAMMMTSTLLQDMGPISVIVISVAAAIAAGGLMGLVSGLCIAGLRLNPLMVTLAMTSVVAGFTLYVTKGTPIYGMPDAFIQQVGRSSIAGLPFAVVVALVIALIGWVVQRRTSLGRHIYAVGGNAQSARLSGVNVGVILATVYAISGALAAVTGVLLTARIGSGQSAVGDSITIESIAAAVIGGVSLQGGTGRIERVVLAAVFISVIANGLNLTRIDSKYQTLVLGAVLIAAVLVDRIIARKNGNV